MKCFVGTSGWYYSWNEGMSLDWYVENSGLNAVELNASFYRFPYPNQVKGWAKKGKLRWAIKVSRLITHVHKLNQEAFRLWKRFSQLFEPLNSKIDFFLLQLPPSVKPTLWRRIESFVQRSKEERFAIEFRNKEWFQDKWVERVNEIGTFVSVDSPEERFITSSRGRIYLRMHGRSVWYSHNYSDEELREVIKRIRGLKPKKVYVFFNNDHDMLNNARRMEEMLSGEKG